MDRKPLATIVLVKEDTVSDEELTEFFIERLCKIPDSERLCYINEVPKTSVGKFDKKEIRRLFAEGKLT
jgi:fatty-acyl-CoA synthase